MHQHVNQHPLFDMRPSLGKVFSHSNYGSAHVRLLPSLRLQSIDFVTVRVQRREHECEEHQRGRRRLGKERKNRTGYSNFDGRV